MKLYQKNKYDKIIKNLNNFKKYESVNIKDFSLIFFLISEENSKFIDQFLTKINYKDKVLTDIANPNFLSPLNFSLLNDLNEISELLKSHGANIYFKGKNGNTLAHISCFYGKIKALEYAM